MKNNIICVILLVLLAGCSGSVKFRAEEVGVWEIQSFPKGSLPLNISGIDDFSKNGELPGSIPEIQFYPVAVIHRESGIYWVIVQEDDLGITNHTMRTFDSEGNELQRVDLTQISEGYGGPNETDSFQNQIDVEITEEGCLIRKHNERVVTREGEILEEKNYSSYLQVSDSGGISSESPSPICR